MSAAPQKAKPGAEKIEVTVSAVVPLNDLVTRFEFTRRDGAQFPPFSGGAHTVVEIDDNGRTRLNPYSLMSDPNDLSAYAISVRRDDEGRGGSLFMHRNVKAGDAMTITFPVNLFSLDLRAKKHIFFAGGIGITPPARFTSTTTIRTRRLRSKTCWTGSPWGPTPMSAVRKA